MWILYPHGEKFAMIFAAMDSAVQYQDQDHHLPQDHSKEDVVLCQEIQDDNEKDANDAPLPEMIAFKPQEINDECSMISSVSDKVRKAWRKSWIESWDDM